MNIKSRNDILNLVIFTATLVIIEIIFIISQLRPNITSALPLIFMIKIPILVISNIIILIVNKNNLDNFLTRTFFPLSLSVLFVNTMIVRLTNGNKDYINYVIYFSLSIIFILILDNFDSNQGKILRSVLYIMLSTLLFLFEFTMPFMWFMLSSSKCQKKSRMVFT